MTRVRWLSALLAAVCAAAACAGRGPAPERAGGFEEVAAAVGVRVTHTSGAMGRKWYPETFGSGVCVTDVDGDDRPDLIFVTGRSWDGESTGAGVAVLRNRGDGTFADVTAASGIRYPFYGMGCAAADYDNDGRDDLLVTGHGGTGLFHNLGGGRFAEGFAEEGGEEHHPSIDPSDDFDLERVDGEEQCRDSGDGEARNAEPSLEHTNR